MTQRGSYRGAHRRGTWGRTAVGASIWQTPGAAEDELDRINDDFLAFSKEITDEVERRGYPVKAGSEHDPVVELFTSGWTPLIQAWQSFYADHGSWLGNLWTNYAPDAEAFQRKLVAIRQEAQHRGMGMLSPAPEAFSSSLLDPHHDVIDTAAEAGKKIGADTYQVIKIAVYGGLALVGVIALSSIVSNLRRGSDPMAPYLKAAGRA